MIPVYWDNGANDFGIFNRSTAAVSDQGVLTAIMQGGGGSTAAGYVTLTNRATGLLLDGMYRSSNGSNAGQWSSSGSDAQQWMLETTGNYVKLKNRATGLYLDGMGATNNGAVAGQWSNSSSNNQQWQRETSGSYVKLKNRATGLYLDGLGQTANGADAGQWGNSSSNNQFWTMTSVGQARKSITADSAQVHELTDNQVLLYPNPFTSTFKMTVDKSREVVRVTIFDLTGKQVEVIERPSASGLMSMGASLKAGTYVVRVEGVNWLKTSKIIKVD